MNDIKIFKKCKKCGHWLTLMESIRMSMKYKKGIGKTYVGVRCLHCGGTSFIELWQINQKATIDKNNLFYKEYERKKNSNN